MKKIVLLSLAFMLLAVSANSQDFYNAQAHQQDQMSDFEEPSLLLKGQDGDGFFSSMADVNLPRRGYFINANLGSSNLVNSTIEENWDSKGDFGYRVEFGMYRKIKPLLAWGVGLGLSSYANEISRASFKDTLTGLQDQPNVEPIDVLNERIEYLSVDENTRVTYLDVPVFIEFGNPNIDKIGYYLRLGVKVSIPVADNFSGNGNYTVKGFYPDYNVELVNIPELGFVLNDQMYTGNTNYELNSINISGLISGGVTFALSNSMILRAGAYYDYGFSDISKESTLGDQDRQIDVSHILENNESATYIRGFGFEVGIVLVKGVF